MNKIFSILAIFMLLTTTSCLNGDDDKMNKQSFTAKCYNKIYTNGEFKITDANYNVEFDFTANTVTITTADTEISPSAFKICNIPLSSSATKGNYFTSALPKVTNTAGVEIPSLKITDFYGQWTGLSLKFTYTVNGTTVVYGSYIEDIYSQKSNTVVTAPGGGQPFVWTEASYDITVKSRSADSNTRKADLIIDNVKFSDKMPITLSKMLVEGLNVEPTATGLKLTAESIVPKLNNVEKPDYTLSEIECTVMPNFNPSDLFIKENMTLRFKCMGFSVEANAYIYNM